MIKTVLNSHWTQEVNKDPHPNLLPEGERTFSPLGRNGRAAPVRAKEWAWQRVGARTSDFGTAFLGMVGPIINRASKRSKILLLFDFQFRIGFLAFMKDFSRASA